MNMQSVPDYWYNRLNFALGVGAFFLIAVYGILQLLTDINPGGLGLTPVSGLAAIVTVIYSALGHRLVATKRPWIASFITYIFFAVTAVSVINLSGNYESPLFFLWILVVFMSGAFGVTLIAVTIAFTLVFLALAYFNVIGGSGSGNLGILMAAINIATALVSLEVWRHLYGERGGDHVRKLSKELEAEQVKSEILINAVADGLMAVSMEGKIQVFNPGAEKITGWTAEEAIGIDYNIIMKLFQIDKDKEIALTRNENPFVIATNKLQSVNSEPILHTKNDQSLELSLTVSPIQAEGQTQGLVAIFRDVSEKKKQERQRTEFISTASHEMRTPVAAIEGYLSLAMNDKVASIDQKARSYLVKAYESTQHLGQLFKDLLAAAKSEDGRLSNHPEVVELGEFLTKITEDLRFSAEKKGLTLDFVTATGNSSAEQVVSPLFYVNVDPERIREVITNLVNNGIKFTEKGGVIVGLRGDKNVIQITVQDSGFGIPEEDVPHLFQKFYRVDNTATRTIGGTGLGLFITRNIVELYNGRIWVESKVGEGSTFYINLPRLSSQQADQLKQQQDAALPPVTVKQNQL